MIMKNSVDPGNLESISDLRIYKDKSDGTYIVEFLEMLGNPKSGHWRYKELNAKEVLTILDICCPGIHWI